MDKYDFLDKYFDSLKTKMQDEYKELMWPAIVGNLKGEIYCIFINLACAHPEAFESVVNQFNKGKI